MKRFYLIIKGDVQGVNFRYYTKQIAKELNIKGYVKNTFNGVEVVAEGKDKDMKEFISWCKKGPSSAEVTDFKIKREKYKNEFKDFSIKYFLIYLIFFKNFF